MNTLATVLIAIGIAGLAWGALAWLVRQSPFAFRDVVIGGDLVRVQGAHLEAVIREELTGTFFTMDLVRAREALLRVPWVRAAALRRQWPDRLELTIDEHEPLARWNDTALVSTRGEIFSAQSLAELPLFTGPDEAAVEMTDRYRAWSAALAPLALGIGELRLSPRGGWQVVAVGDAGPLTLQLGRDEPDVRLARFVSAHGRTLAPLARVGMRVDALDLRYRNGFAVRVPGFKEKPARPAR